jgi:hypothetical protein
MSLRVVQGATGSVGVAAIKGIQSFFDLPLITARAASGLPR